MTVDQVTTNLLNYSITLHFSSYSLMLHSGNNWWLSVEIKCQQVDLTIPDPSILSDVLHQE